MSVYQREETYYHWITFRNRAKELSDPGSVKVTITAPCGIIVVSSATMEWDSEGIYYYTYNIPADGVYGEYDVKTVATTDTDVSIFKDKFYLLLWDIVDQTRKLSGITSKKSISDDDIATIIWEAYLEALREVYVYWHDVTPGCNPDTGAWFDGTNTTFSSLSSKLPLADSNGDGEITGYGELSCGTDVDGHWVDSNGDCHQLKITVLDAKCGKLTITQLDGTAIPSNNCGVKINYYTEWRTFNLAIFKSAVAFLAAHKCIERFAELDKATLADLHSNKIVILHNRKRMEIAYKNAMRKISRPVIGAGMLHGE